MDFANINPELGQSVLHSCPICFLTHVNGLVTDVTPYTESFLGISPGDHLDDFIVGSYDTSRFAPTNDIGDFQNWECVDIKTKFGDVKHMEVKTYAVSFSGENVSLTWLQDVGRLKRAENTLKFVRGDTKKQSRAFSEKTAKASFELRRGLNSILGLTELLEDGEDNEGKKAYLKQLKQSTTELVVVMEALINPESGRQAEKERFSLQKILQKVENAIRLRLDKRSLAYQVLCQDDIPADLLGYPKHIQDVLVILAKNSIGFTTEGSITVRATEHDRDENSITLLFSVCDTGCGMPPEQVAALFPQFPLDDDDYPIHYNNGGLGLATVQTLVDSLDGRVWCDSTPGAGTTVYFTARCEFIRNNSENTAPQHHPNTDGYTAEGIQILVVDDNKVNQTVASALLKKKGYTVVTADSGIEAVDILKENGGYHLVLMDVYMPDMDGPTATKIIREMYPELPIVALTACAMPGDREMCLSLGMNDYFTKPYEAKDLINLVYRWTSR